MMLTKFESKSNRVKGLAFHPKRPWILASLHNGSVQWWDYRMGTLLERFDEHEGPVRGISFHSTQPLFVSGGDDYKIKVWNHKLRRCLFTLNGHLDYVRTVFFHNESPWIVSASDDQTIRVWNWQSRNCLSILTGHNHYVMCAQFHPKQDMIVSASLDQTVRVWDISGLRKKHSAPGTVSTFEDHSRQHGQDIFGNSDAVTKFVLEGHDRGVNWVSFHPSLPLIVSAADDRQIKLWRMSETKAWEVDTFRGHYNNVSCVLFHPRQELIISNSEDKTIRVWDMSKRTISQTFRREHDRFWILAAHPELNLFAAGHDSGLIVFKLERERPAYTIHQNSLFYVRDKSLHCYDFNSNDDVSVAIVKRGNGSQAAPRTVSYNPTEKMALVCTPIDNGVVELYTLQKDGSTFRETSAEPKRFFGNAGIFVARNRFAILDKARQQIAIHDTKSTNKIKEIKSPVVANEMFYAGIGHVLLSSPTSVVLMDVQQGITVAEMNVSGVKYVVWAPDMSMVALLSKHTISIAGKKLEQLALIHETIRIKSAAWDDSGVLIYTTLNHIKYSLPQGDNGIIRTLDQPLYLAKVRGSMVFCLDREGKTRNITIDPTEFRFKLALVRRDYDQVLNIINNSNLVGQSIIAYLQKKGYPEVALHFVQDPKTRFELALECGNLTVALETCKAMDKDACWIKLASEALKQGNYQMVEMAYQRIKNFDRLSFLYLASGSTDKLRKMMKIAEVRGDTMSRFHNALYLGDVDERIKILKEVGQLQLAYLTAKSHGLHDEAASIAAACGISPENLPPIPSNGSLLHPPAPLLRQTEKSWPISEVSKGYFEGGVSNADDNVQIPAAFNTEAATADWGEDEEEAKTPGAGQQTKSPTFNMDVDADAGWDLDDADLKLANVPAAGGVTSTGGVSAGPVGDGDVFPMPGPNIKQLWSRNSMFAADHIAAGSFETAVQLLNRQLGIVNFPLLKPKFISTFQASSTYLPCLPGSPSISLPVHRNRDETDTLKLLPVLTTTLSNLNNDLQEAYRQFTAGKFTEALALFQSLLHQALFVVPSNATEYDELRNLITTSREYVLGLKLEIARRDVPAENIARSLELAAYFTHCQLQTPHMQLSLRSAMTLSFKADNFSSAAQFARRLLELNPNAQVAQRARQLITVCEQTPTDKVKINYDPMSIVAICGMSFTALSRSAAMVKDPYTGACYKVEYKGKVDNLAELSQIGMEASGIPRV